jgi:hypothetical protein
MQLDAATRGEAAAILGAAIAQNSKMPTDPNCSLRFVLLIFATSILT